MNLGLPFQLDWQASKAPGSTGLYPPVLGLQVHTTTSGFCELSLS